MKPLKPRERLLASIVGGVLFLLLNLVFFNYLVKQHTRLRSELASKTAEWNTMQTLFADRELWEKREAWLAEKQPKLTSESGAGVALLDQVKGAASKNDVTIENPAIAFVERDAVHIGVPVDFETKSSWAALVKFLAALQQPDQFIVFDSADVQIDAADATMIRGKFRATRWHAPKT